MIRDWVVSRVRKAVAQRHFVDDYEKLVKRLVATYPIDEAMSRAVGGNYEIVGQIEADIVTAAGLADGMAIVDLGCGSGRLASTLHQRMNVSYVGIDIVQALLDYAQGKAPKYRFIRHRDLSIPLDDASMDMVSAFSLFTHLQQAEIYIYLEECVRVLKPGGRVVFSFLEFTEPKHWQVFENTKAGAKVGIGDHLNMFLERATIDFWASRLALSVERYYPSTATWNGHALEQSLVVLRKP